MSLRKCYGACDSLEASLFIFPVQVPFCPAPSPPTVLGEWCWIWAFGCSECSKWKAMFVCISHVFPYLPLLSSPCCPSHCCPPLTILPLAVPPLLASPCLPSLSSPAAPPTPAFTRSSPRASQHPSSRPCKCTDHLDFRTAGPLFIAGQAAAWFYGVIKVLTGVIKASNCTAETLGVYFKGP